MKDRYNIKQDIKIHEREDVRVIYKDNHSLDSGSKDRYKTCHNTIGCGEHRYERRINPSFPFMTILDHTQELTLVQGGDKVITRNILTSGDDDPEVVED